MISFDTAILLDTALAFAEHGYSVVPPRTDGTKAPAAFWKQFQARRADPDEIRRWLAGGTYEGIGLVCGAISGNLEMLELEGRALEEGIYQQFAAAMKANNLADIWRRLHKGYMESTPSGGLHWLYRVDGPALPNRKLARRPSTPEELTATPDARVQVLIETRGEGGYVVVAPSGGRTHPSGDMWKVAVGSPATIPTLSEDERDALHAVASFLDRMPVEQHSDKGSGITTTSDTSAGQRPGDAYSAAVNWDDILGPVGWKKVRKIGDGWAWRRPGKDRGVSATTGTSADGADRLYVFSTSTDFDAEKPYGKFAAYTRLHHGGDYVAAAADLRGKGYGDPIEPSRRVDPTDLIATDGALARVIQHPSARPKPAAVESTFERSDDGNALLLVDRYGDVLRYCPDRSRWLAWDGTRWHWCPSTGGVAREYAKRIARTLPDSDHAGARHKQRSLSAVGTSAMLTQAATDARVVVGIDDLDAHPWELNTPAGIVDLCTGELKPPDPARMHTRTTIYAPDPGADLHRWADFLGQTFGQDAGLIAYLQRLVGYSAVGLVGPHVLPFCYGSGNNGKGVFLEAVTKVLGDYATTAPSGFLMAQQHASHETEIARLAGARMVLCSEVNEDDRFDEAKVKQLTGGDTLTARFMRQDHFTFHASHQLWLMGNHQPTVRSGGRSFWRRLRLIPFAHEVPEEKQIDDLQNILARDHGPALLAWIVGGAVAYSQGGLRDPESVRAATAEYAHDQDTVGRFVEERCILGGGSAVKLKVSDVRAAYEQWCHAEGEQPVTAKALGLAMQRHGVETTKGTKGQRFYVGVTLTGQSMEGDV